MHITRHGTHKTCKQLRLDSNTLTVKESKECPDADCSSAFLAQQCLKRRGVAYHFARLINFEAHERYLSKLFMHLTEVPPPGYRSASLTQILHVCQNVSDIRPTATGELPLDTAIMNGLNQYSAAFHCFRCPRSLTMRPAVSRERLADPHGVTKSTKKGKGKGSKRSKGTSFAPKVLTGCSGRDAKGRCICFDYNINGCPHAPAGGACRKGRHICAKVGCNKVHAFFEVHKDDKPSDS